MVDCAYCEAPNATHAPSMEGFEPDARYCDPTCSGLAAIAGMPGEHGTLPEAV